MNDRVGVGMNREDLRSWGCSLVLHGLLLAVAGWGWSKESILPPYEVFEWEVELIGYPQKEPENPVAAEGRSERRLRVVPAQTPLSATVTAAPHDQRPEPVAVEAGRLIDTVSRVQASAMSRTEVPSVSKVDSLVGMKEPVPAEVAAQGAPHAVEASPSLTEPTGPDSPAGAVSASPFHAAPQLASVEDPAKVGMSNAVSEVTPRSLVAVVEELTAARGSMEISSERVAEHSPHPAQVAVASTVESPVPVPPGVKRDFGWLMQTLWNRVADVKRYPREARINRWEGRVVIRAVIDEHGHLVEATVAASSGHEVLDQAAIEVIRRACPVELSQSLDQPQVVLRVPIQYRLDS